MAYFCQIKTIIRKYSFEILIILLAISALFYQSGKMPLSADEPIRSLIALDMEYNGHFVAPELNGDTYLNKPPLYNWIILGFYKVFGSHAEWVLRLPSLLSLLLFGFVLFWIVRKEANNFNWAVISGMALITGGNMLFYSSYLGHIDITYSLLTFIQIYAIHYYFRSKEFGKLYAISYALAFLGFMMKGLPSVVFQGISLFVVFTFQQNFRKLFSLKHAMGALFFVLPLCVYFYLFSKHSDLNAFLSNLFNESASRTVTDKSFLESITHLFSFPFLFLMDLMPWGLLGLIFFKKEARNWVWQNTFYRICILLFLSNIIIYWLSPEYRARYVFMLMPFYLIPSIAAFSMFGVKKRYNLIERVMAILGILCLAAMAVFVYRFEEMPYSLSNILFVIILANIIISSLITNVKRGTRFGYLTVIVLLCLRMGYSEMMVPWRMVKGPYLREKEEAKRLALVSKDLPIYMYHSNVSLTMNWYLSLEKGSIITTERSPTDMEALYLVPDDVLADRNNVEVFDTFVRRYKNKPFSLVRFKSYFPPMPKKATTE